MPEATHAYVAFRPCGCICAAISDKPALRRDIARETGRWIRAGLRVERVTKEAVHAGRWDCPHAAAPVPKQAPLPLEEDR